MMDTSQLSYQSGGQPNTLERLRVELLTYTDKLEATLNDEQARERERQVHTLSSELKDTVSGLLEAAANQNPEQLMSILNEKMGEEFVRSYSDIIQRFHVEKKTETASKPTPKQPQVELPAPRQGISKSLSMGAPSPSKQGKDSGGGILKSVWGMFGKKEAGASKPTQIILNENEPKHYYCPRRKRFVIEGEEDAENKPIAPPPKKSELKATPAPEQKKPETEMDSMIAPPPFVRGKKKGPKQEKVVKQMVLEELPPVMDFSQFRRKVMLLFDEASATQQSSGCSTKLIEQFVEKLHTDLQHQEQLAVSVTELMRDSYELLLSNSRLSPATQITILNQNHSSSLGMVDMMPKSRMKILTMEEENQRLRSIEMQQQIERSDYEAKISDYQRKIRELEESLERDRGVLEQRIREREDSVARVSEEAQGRRSEADRLEAQLAETKTSAIKLQAEARHLKKSLDELNLQLSTKEAELQNRDSIIKQTSDSLEQCRHELRQTLEELKLKESKIRSLDSLVRESDATLIQHRNNEESLRRCYTSVLRSKTSLTQMTECLDNENLLLEKIKKRRSNLVESAAAVDARIQNQLLLQESAGSERPTSNFLEMSTLVNDIIVRSTSTTREYQCRTKELLQELNVVKEQFTTYRETADTKIKNLSSQVMKVKAAMDGFKSEAVEATSKVETLKKDKLRLEKELDKLKYDSNFAKQLVEQANKASNMNARKVEEVAAELAKLRKDKEKADATAKRVEQENSELTNLAKAIEQEKDRLEEQQAELQEECEAAKKQIDQLKQQSELREQALAHERTSKDALSQDYQQLYSSYNGLQAELKLTTEQHASEKKRLVEELAILQQRQQEEAGRLNKQLSLLSAQLVEQKDQTTAEKQQKSKMVQDIEHLIGQAQAKDAECQQLRTAAATLTAEINSLRADMAVLQQQQSQYEQTLAQQSATHRTQLSELEQYHNKQLEELAESMATEFQQKREQLQREHSASLEQHASAARQELQAQLTQFSNNVEQIISSRTTLLIQQHTVELSQAAAVHQHSLEAERKERAAIQHSYQSLVRQLQSTLMERVAQLNEANDKVSEVEEVLLQLSEDLQNKTQDLEQRKAEAENIRQLSLNHVHAEQQRYREQVGTLTSQLEEQKRQNANLLQDISQLKFQLADEKQKGSDCIAAIRKHEENEQTKGRIITLMEKDLLAITEQRKSYEEIVQRLSGENEQLKYQIDASNEMNKALAENEIDELKSKILDMESELKDRQALIEAMSEDLAAKAEQSSALTASLEAEKENGSHLSIRINQLVSEMLQYKQQTAETVNADVQAEAMRERMAVYERQAAKLKEDIACLTFESEEMKAYYEKKLVQFGERIAELTDSKQTTAYEVEQRASQLMQELDKVRQENVQWLDSGKQLVFENRQLRETVQKLKEQLASQSSKEASKPASVEQSTPSSTPDEGMIAEMEQMIERQEQVIAKLEGDNAELVRSLGELKTKLSAQDEQLQQVEQERKTLQSANSHLTEELSKLRKLQYSSSENTQDAQREITEMQMMLENQQTELEEARQSNAKMTQDKAAKERDILQLQGQLQKLKESLADNTRRQAAYEEKIDRLEAELGQSKASDVKKLQEKVKTLELENEQLLKQKVELLNNNDKLVARLAVQTVPAEQPSTPSPQTARQATVRADRPTQQFRLTQSQPISEPPKPQGFLMTALSKVFLTSKQQQKLSTPNN